MPTYISMMKLTEQGMQNIKDSPQRIESARKGIEAMGGKLIAIYTTMGEYDYISVAEFSSEEAGMTFLLTLGAMGNVRTTTLRAYTEKEFAAIVQKLP